MTYQAEFEFLQNLLTNMNLHFSVISSEQDDLHAFDFHLRKILGLEQDYLDLLSYAQDNLKPNTIYHVSDSFGCHYDALLLPDTDPAALFIIGPYSTEKFSRTMLTQLMEQHSLSPQYYASFEKYFDRLPFVSDQLPLAVMLNTFGQKIWGGADQFSTETLVRDLTDLKPSAPTPSVQSEPEDSYADMQNLEQRYQHENLFLQAVSQGQNQKARQLISTFPAAMEQRTLDTVRNTKNYTIVLNTLLRKAAELGTVHPYHIDRLSSSFAHRIEQCNSVTACMNLQQEMIHKYCLLVKNHSMKGYSLLVQKVITRIDSDLTADLSLNALSSLLNVNASYLSGLFKKETGSTLTDYVNRKRIGHGILLLNATALQVQTVAQYCGIPDVNYFAKLFKKYIGKTPKEYREAVTHSSRS